MDGVRPGWMEVSVQVGWSPSRLEIEMSVQVGWRRPSRLDGGVRPGVMEASV